ncbi:MAG: DUF1987 domain-containing protein [Bacteroidota bacterium]
MYKMLLNIPATHDTPELVFSAEKGYLTIMGNACGTEMADFFKPVLDATKRYLRESDSAPIKVIFRMENVNTSATKYMMMLLNSISTHANPQREIELRWIYPSGDADLRELGEDLAEELELPMRMQALPRDVWRKAS